MAFTLRRTTSKSYILLFQGEDIGSVFCHEIGPRPWVAMLYKARTRHLPYFPRPFVEREHSFETLSKLRDWLSGYRLPVSKTGSRVTFNWSMNTKRTSSGAALSASH